MKNQDQKTKKKKSLKEKIRAELAEAFEVNLLEVDHLFKDDIEELDFDLEDTYGDSF